MTRKKRRLHMEQQQLQRRQEELDVLRATGEHPTHATPQDTRTPYFPTLGDLLMVALGNPTKG